MRCAVLGSPIGHSKSPALHRAAYGVLGLDWSYDAIDLVGPALPAFLDALGEEWRGLSLTMPLKRDVLPLLDWADPIARLTGGANTVLLAGTGAERTRRGYNTDVRGIDQAFRDAGVTSLGTVHLIGGGATAASALAAVAGLGASRAVVSVRTPARAEDLIQVGEQLGVAVTVRDWTEQSRVLAVPDAVISTLPGGVPLPVAFSRAVRASAVLFDVAYEPWPSALAVSWRDAGGTVIRGLDMLVHQALAQLRIFVNGDPDRELEGESTVLAAMRAAVAP